MTRCETCDATLPCIHDATGWAVLLGGQVAREETEDDDDCGCAIKSPWCGCRL